MSNNTINPDTLVMELFAKVAAKKKEIESISRPQWETSCSFGTDPDRLDTRVNLQVVDIPKLVELYAFILQKQEAYKTAAKELGVTVPSKWLGYTFDAWKSDIKLRVNIININAKKKELDTLETRVNALVSPEQRRALELAEIQKALA